jgi:predicted component of type VI protein secretion system
MDRISVGRARNKDIVLRHQSVSKFHCWFEVDDVGAFYVTDAGSKNATKVNTKTLKARERTHVEPGDVIRFGSVESILCSPRVLWGALSGGKRTG